MAIKLTEKQQAKVNKAVADIDLAAAQAALDALRNDASAANLKAFRKAAGKELRKADLALAEIDIDLFTDDAAAFAEKIEAKFSKKAKA